MRHVSSVTAAVVFFLNLASATNFLNHTKLLAGLEDPAWFEQNVPILDVPNQQIQDVYYYRWTLWREHLHYTGAQFGYLITEFLPTVPIGYSSPYGGIVAAAGHHINEGRWLRDQKPGQDLVNFWLSGPGQQSKPANAGVNPDTYDWAHEYSFWSSSLYRQFLVTGNQAFATALLDNLVKQYRGYDNHFNSSLNLYWQAPVWDASEYTAASYESSDPYHGGYGYRPTINSYQYGDAKAIAALATLAGNMSIASEYTSRASNLSTALQNVLWDSSAQFFKHRQRDNNTSGALLDTREYMGYIPWMFNVPLSASYSAAFSQLKDPAGFSTAYGPSTTETRSRWYEYEAAGNCCRWDGPSWPFATSQILTAAENLLNDYPAQTYFNATDYFTLISRYAATQYRNGTPYVAEAHNSSLSNWEYDSYNHSEDYAHSTYVDNVISGLIGLRAQSNTSLVIVPLTPSSWDHFGLENVAYHGHNITVIWDSTGTYYGQGKGFKVYVDGNAPVSQATVGPVTVQVGSTIQQTISTLVNIAANGEQFSQGTQPNASYAGFPPAGDSIWNAIDGNIIRLGVPENTRWTTYSSTNAQDWLSIDLRRAQAISDVRLYFYDDGGGVQVPSNYDLQVLNGSTWTTIPQQQRSATPTNNAQIRITFPQIMAQQLRVLASNRGSGNGWGLSEFQVWTAPIFQISNVNSNKLMGVAGQSMSNSANIQQYQDNGTRDHLWQFIQSPGGFFKIKNLNSAKLLAVVNASTADSAQLQQYDDTGTPDHLWHLEDQGSGQFFIRNKNSGLLAGVDGESTQNGANVVQFHDNGTPDHLWTILAAVPSQ